MCEKKKRLKILECHKESENIDSRYRCKAKTILVLGAVIFFGRGVPNLQQQKKVGVNKITISTPTVSAAKVYDPHLRNTLPPKNRLKLY